MAWLGWLIGISTLFSALDLLRLNFQLELGGQLNMIGYSISCFIFFVILLLLILILNNWRAGLEAVAGSAIVEPVTTNIEPVKVEESAADYQSLFVILDRELRAQQWYCLPRLTLNQLSDLSGMSPRDISRAINLVAGISFNDYINQHRIEQIKQALLAEGNTKASINLTELAFAAGFSSKATFNQSFKKATGMTPSEFRNVQHVQNQASSRLITGD